MTSDFQALVALEPPTDAPVLLGTACVLGGSVAGLLAARVLADYSRDVVIVERDQTPPFPTARPGTPHDRQEHTLLPAGHRWIERWLPGFTADAVAAGATVADVSHSLIAFDGQRQAHSGADHQLLGASRPLLEACLRNRVLALPNVSVVTRRATGLTFRDDVVAQVECEGSVISADFVVDAMGRGTQLGAWLNRHGFARCPSERLRLPINYATAAFERREAPAELDIVDALALFSSDQPVSVAAGNAIEDDQWLITLMGYDDERPGRTAEDFRRICAVLPPFFQNAVKGRPTREIVTYRQADSRRRDFTTVGRFPGRLVAIGDAVASFNPVYAQGMSSAALQASALSAYLSHRPDFDRAATEYFRLQNVVVDAAWELSAGTDAARLQTQADVAVPKRSRRRTALEEIAVASLTDSDAARTFNEVSYLLRHPDTLVDYPG